MKGIQNNIDFIFFFIVGLILPGHYESKLLVSKQPGDQWLKIISEGLGNEDRVPCPRALLPLPADSNPDLTIKSPWSYPLNLNSSFIILWIVKSTIKAIV